MLILFCGTYNKNISTRKISFLLLFFFTFPSCALSTRVRVLFILRFRHVFPSCCSLLVAFFFSVFFFMLFSYILYTITTTRRTSRLIKHKVIIEIILQLCGFQRLLKVLLKNCNIFKYEGIIATQIKSENYIPSDQIKVNKNRGSQHIFFFFLNFIQIGSWLK